MNEEVSEVGLIHGHHKAAIPEIGMETPAFLGLREHRPRNPLRTASNRRLITMKTFSWQAFYPETALWKR